MRPPVSSRPDMTSETVKTRPLRVGLVQQTCGDSRDANLQSSIDGIREAAAAGALTASSKPLIVGFAGWLDF